MSVVLNADQIAAIQYHQDCIKAIVSGADCLPSAPDSDSGKIKTVKKVAKKSREMLRKEMAEFMADYLKTPWLMDYL